MKKLLSYLLPAALLLVSCGGGDGNESSKQEPKPGSTVNDNKNDATGNPLLARLEMPRVKGGRSELISHATSNYGVTYSLEWDHEKQAQRWTCYDINRRNYVTNGNTRKSLWNGEDPWNKDPDVPANEQQEPYNELSKSYYPGTQNAYYEKGHICPSADKIYTKDANEQTFFMTNIMPMVKDFNGGIWGSMENRVRGWLGDPSKRTWSNYCDTLFVCKGGTIDKDSHILGRTKGGHIVPRYYFMALLAKKGDTYKALGFWAEHLNENHANDPLGKYVVSIDQLEDLTGIDFFCNLPDDVEKKVQSASVEDIKSNWGLR